VWSDEWIDAIGKLGAFTFIELDGPMSDDEAADVYRAHDIAIVGWTERQIPEALATDAGALRYVCSYSGSIRGTVPRSIVESGIIVSNWGDLPAAGVAEGALTLLLALAHQLPSAVRTQHDGGWGVDGGLLTRLEDLAVGVYGCGVIGARFVEMLRPFGPRVRVYDPYAPELPDGVEPCNSLGELCAWSEALVIHAGLSDETERSLGAAELAQLRDGAIVVNTARGAIVDQDALVAELVSGRLRAGLDVLEPDVLAPEHPIRQLDNVLLTYHQAESGDWPPRPGLSKAQLRVLEQLERFARGEMPQWTFDLERYDRST
jgi:phosphoglycerate dehydrogenase-like enzyme